MRCCLCSNPQDAEQAHARTLEESEARFKAAQDGLQAEKDALVRDSRCLLSMVRQERGWLSMLLVLGLGHPAACTPSPTPKCSVHV